MTQQIIKGQTFLIDLESKLSDDLNAAIKKEIWYKKPEGENGKWDATVVGNHLQFKVLPSMNDQVGTWEVMIYLEFSDDDIYKGKIVKIKVYDSLPGA